MIRFKTPADYYTFINKEIINDEFIFNSPYSPSIDLIYGDDFSIYESRKMMRNYCIEFNSSQYAENKWKFFPVIYQFQNLDSNLTELEDYYYKNIKNDAELENESINHFIYHFISSEVNNNLKKSKEKLLQYYLDHNTMQFQSHLNSILDSLTDNLKVFDFIENEIDNSQFNSLYQDVIIIQQKSLIKIFRSSFYRYIVLLEDYLKNYCDEEFELFDSKFSSFINNQMNNTKA